MVGVIGGNVIQRVHSFGTVVGTSGVEIAVTDIAIVEKIAPADVEFGRKESERYADGIGRAHRAHEATQERSRIPMTTRAVGDDAIAADIQGHDYRPKAMIRVENVDRQRVFVDEFNKLRELRLMIRVPRLSAAGITGENNELGHFACAFCQ